MMRKGRVVSFPYFFLILWSCQLFCFTLGYRAQSEIQTCGVLFEDRGLSGRNLTVFSGWQFLDLNEDYVPTTLQHIWNLTSLSVTVQSECVFTGCNETFFNGQCIEFRQDALEFPQGFGGVVSLNCTCSQDCSCEDVPNLRKKECARAYLGKQGCDSCNPLYIGMSGIAETVHEALSTNIGSLIVNAGCELTVYDDVEQQGEALPVSGIAKNWTRPVESFECVCDSNAVSGPIHQPPRQPHWPELIDVPTTIEEITEMLSTEGEQYHRHPGLVAALRSSKAKRSPKNAYILLLGTTGAGKSSAVNLLFDNPNVTKVGGTGISTTKDIHEFRIPIVVDELGIRNAELRVIDTPGLGDTQGLDRDARFLATLEEFLDSHEELKDRIPNVVLIFHKFMDNRFDGDGAQFVQVLRGLDAFRERITDKKYSNVVFVFSHFMSEVPTITRKPKVKIARFKSVIQGYTMFPAPIMTAMAENKPVDQGLPMFNGYYKLPNGDYYPRNLFDRIEQLTLGGEDDIGRAVTTSAFRDPDSFNISHTAMAAVDMKNSKVQKYFKILTNTVFGINNTEASQDLAKVYEEMDPELKRNFPDALPNLQKMLNLLHISSKSDVPKTTQGIVKLFANLRRNEAVLFLMDRAFGVKPPLFPHSTVTGFSYNVFKDTPLPASPYRLGSYRGSDAGYQFPDVLSCNIDIQTKYVFLTPANKASYVAERVKSLGISGSLDTKHYTGKVRQGYNLMTEYPVGENGTRIISAVQEFRRFQLELDDRPTFSKEFVDAVSALVPFNSTDVASVESWKNFFDTFGTHVVKSGYGGGSITVNIQTHGHLTPDVTQAILDFVRLFEDVAMGNTGGNGTLRDLSKSNLPYSITFTGGNEGLHVQDITKLTMAEATILLGKWLESIALSPVMLTSEYRLIPLSQIVKKMGKNQNITAEIERATTLLFNAELTYVPPPSVSAALPGPDRSETFMRQQIEITNMYRAQLDRMQNESLARQQIIENMTKQIMEEGRKRDADRIQMQQEMMEWQRRQDELREQYRLEQREREKADIEERIRQAAREHEIRKQELASREAAAAGRRAEIEAERSESQKLTQMLIAELSKPTTDCLREGTMVLMADWTEKPVQDLTEGDVVLTHELKPTIVSAVQKKFLVTDAFFSFILGGNKSSPYFFTRSHMFAGPALKRNPDDVGLQILVQSVDKLYDENPLMEYIGAKRFLSDQESSNVLCFNQLTKSVETCPLTSISQDPVPSAPSTEVYILLVEDPVGTYFANGFVCRHEVPPFHFWPNTMQVLLTLVGNPELGERVREIPYTLESLKKVKAMVENLREQVKEELKGWVDGVGLVEEQIPTDALLSFAEINMDTISEVFRNREIFAAWAFELYAQVGPLLAGEWEANGVQQEETILDFKLYMLNVLREKSVALLEKYFSSL